MAKKSSNIRTKEIASYAVVILVIAAVLAAIVYVYKAQQLSTLPDESQSLQNVEPTPVRPTPTARPIPYGPLDFRIVTTSTGPKMTSGILNERNVPVGGKMTISVKANDTQPITKLWAIMKTDTKTSSEIPFRLVSGTELNGEWQAIWTPEETYHYSWFLILQAKSANGTSKIEIELI